MDRFYTMMDWFKSWVETWKLVRQARRIIIESPENSLSKLKTEAILRGLHNRTLCRNCLQPFDPKTRQFAEVFQVRSILMIPDKELDPMLCDNCFEAVVSTYNLQATNVGTSNSGHTNMVLQKLG